MSVSSEPISASLGGLALSIRQTFPSAALITELGFWGVFLFGFLKKHNVKNVKK